MLLTIALILFVLWLIGAIAHVTLGGLLYVLLIAALIVFIYDLVVRNRRPRL